MTGSHGFELLEVDPHGYATNIATYHSFQHACDVVVTCDTLPTVVVVANSRGDDRRILDSGPFDFAARATIVGFTHHGRTNLQCGDLYGTTVGQVKWWLAEWWADGIRELSLRRRS